MRRLFIRYLCFACTAVGAVGFGFGVYLIACGALWRFLGEAYDPLAWVPWIAAAIGVAALAIYLAASLRPFRFQVAIMLFAGALAFIGGTAFAPILGCTDDVAIREHQYRAEREYFGLGATARSKNLVHTN